MRIQQVLSYAALGALVFAGGGGLFGAASGANPVNLASGRAITALTNTVQGVPANVTDGVSNVWYSYQGTGGAYINSFTIDLGASYSIGKINLYASQTAAVTIWSSPDGAAWTQRHAFNWTAATGLTTPTLGAPVTINAGGAYAARYLKYEGKAWWNQYVGIMEFEVYEWQGGGPAEPSLAGLANLAAGKAVANGPGYSSTAGHDPGLLTDGNTATYWEGSYKLDNCTYIYNTSLCPLNKWFNTYGYARIDLGSAQPVQAIRITFPQGTPGAQSFLVALNDASDTWSPNKWWGFWGDPAAVASKPVQTSSATQKFFLPAPVTARYVWLYMQNWVMEAAANPSVAEVEVFGALPVSQTPSVGLVTPSGGNTATQAFTFTFTDPQGYQDLDVVNVLVNNFLDGRVACYLAYSRPLNVLYLVNDPGTALLPGLVLNGSGTLSNSQCTVNGAGTSATGAGNTLTLTLNMTFPAGFGGNRIFYAAARDTANNSGWKGIGTWNVPGLQIGQLTTMGVTPAQGAGNAQTFTFTFTDTFGWQNLGVLNVLINDALDGRFGCYLAYSRPLNVLYLVNDTGTALLPGLLLNGSGTLANSYCTINGAGATATGNGNVVTLTLPVTFTSAFGGNRLLYMAARDVAENNSGWQAKGAWLVP